MRQFVTDVALVHNDQFSFLQLFDQCREFGLVELLGEQRIDRIFKRSYLSRPGLAASPEVFYDCRNLLVATGRVRQPQQRNFRQVLFSLDAYSPAPEVIDQRVKPLSLLMM